MARQLRPLDPSAGPIQAFAAELRKLHVEAGRPTFLAMSRKTSKSRTALTEAVGGDHLPMWETVAAFVTACGGKPNDWRARWEEARDGLEETRANSAGSDPATTVDVEAVSADPPASPAHPPISSDSSTSAGLGRTRRLLPFIATALAAAIVGSIITALIMTSTRVNPVPQAQPATVIKVQNKSALGPSELIDDPTPAYLSSQTKPFCADNGCKVAGTELASGALLVAVCHNDGTEMFNYAVDSSESKQNPNRVASKLWYRAVFPDGRSGYISEIYIVPTDRGGRGLPQCE